MGDGGGHAHVMLRVPEEMSDWDHRLGEHIAAERGIRSASVTQLGEDPQVPWELF